MKMCCWCQNLLSGSTRATCNQGWGQSKTDSQALQESELQHRAERTLTEAQFCLLPTSRGPAATRGVHAERHQGDTVTGPPHKWGRHRVQRWEPRCTEPFDLCDVKSHPSGGERLRPGARGRAILTGYSTGCRP